MQIKVFVFLFLIYIHINWINSQYLGDIADFCYDRSECSPKVWPGLCNTGRHQSPIKLVAPSGHIPRQSVVMTLDYSYEEGTQEVQVINTGHGVKFNIIPFTVGPSLIDHGRPILGLNIINDTLHLQQLHFHWGPHNYIGSEHIINGKSAPMELHIVHYNNRYEDIKGAVNSSSPQAIAVIALFIHVGKSENLEFSAFADNIGKVMHPRDQVILVEPVRVGRFFPPSWRSNSGSKAIMYSGSLTTPPCSEVVTWIVFEEPVFLSEKQINSFRQIQDHHNNPVSRNYREIQVSNETYVLSSDRRGIRPTLLPSSFRLQPEWSKIFS